jgi:predicted ATPase/DNA-binding CsgD family transcriptional regulator
MSTPSPHHVEPDEHVDPVPIRPGLPRDRPVVSLPSSLTSFVGREREVVAVRGLLERPEVRLLTLTGPGGVGKTRLALRVAEGIAERFSTGVWFVPLAPLADPALVLPTVARVVGVPAAADRTPLDGLEATLGGGESLLLLDNLEQVVEAGPDVADLLAACPRLKVLVSSRAMLRVAGEHTYPVPPLAVPDQERPWAIEDLSRFDAVRLFLTRAQAVAPDLRLSEANAAAFAAICRRLDGLPLAIELAAARCNLLPPPALLARLERRLPLLVGGPRDQPTRLRTMRDAIAWSHDLLAPREQALFRRLAVFVGGFTLEAVEAVADKGGDLGIDVLEGVSSLVDKSLLVRAMQADGEPGAGAPRFGMLETIREFALERLEASGEAEATRRAHADHFLALAAAANVGTKGGELRWWLAWLAAEIDNVRAALGWSLERGDPGLDGALAAALGALWQFWYFSGQQGEEWRWLERALAGDAALPAVRAEALFWEGVLAWTRGDFPRAAEVEEEALALWRGLGNRLGVGQALFFLGVVRCSQGRPDRGRDAMAQALSLFGELGDRTWIALTVLDLYLPAYLEGDLARAEAQCEEGVALWRELGHAWGIGLAVRALGDVVSDRGDAPRAAALYRESLTLHVESGEKRGTADSLSGLAGVAGLIGRSETAARLYGAAEALYAACQVCVPPPDRPAYEPAVARARAGTDDRAWAAAWAAGRALPPEDAIAEALALAADPVAPTVATAETPHPSASSDLSPRELEILRLVAAGSTDREIADALFISRRTVTSHITNILAKLGVDSRTGAATFAVRNGLA